VSGSRDGACPLPQVDDELIQLAHGGGGRATLRLLDTVIRPELNDPALELRHDGTVLELDGPLAFTTDSYVVRPLEFPGGDIGTLAVNGTVNDLAMCGAVPQYLSVSLILEEGLPVATLRRLLRSMRHTARAAGVRLVTGDTKVVDRGKGDGMFVTTSGVGRVIAPAPVLPSRVVAGDVVIVSGDIGRHGIAVLAARESLGFEPPIDSDCAPLAASVRALFDAGIDVHCLRDLTRGGLAAALHEIAAIAASARLAIEIDEPAVPVRADVAAACELLGLDALHVANEGRFAAFVAEREAAAALAALRGHPVCAGAACVGRVVPAPCGAHGAAVIGRGALGIARVIDLPSGEQLPRIC
jgi:hydrogenase expression/formation protein HypE